MKVSTQIKGKPTITMIHLCQPSRDAVQMASGSLSNSTDRITAPIGPMLRNSTPIPWGTQATCWYFQPVVKITISTKVATKIRGRVK